MTLLINKPLLVDDKAVARMSRKEREEKVGGVEVEQEEQVEQEV